MLQCLLQTDWSPYQNFSDYIAKLNLWIIQTQYRRHLNTLNNFQRLGPMSPAARVALVTSPVNTGGGNPNFEAGKFLFCFPLLLTFVSTARVATRWQHFDRLVSFSILDYLIRRFRLDGIPEAGTFPSSHSGGNIMSQRQR